MLNGVIRPTPELMVFAGIGKKPQFVYCERSRWLSRQGHVVSARVQEQRAAGVAFHAERAGAARRGGNNQALWWAILLILAAIALWLAESFAEMPR